ncbi:hypothetical protein P43SY_007456 [Pythium insidiosum]|uniref:Fibronectin type-III domain-containing protein n=1 Tax=Pythium insidiosum TaxID=114742 RepID=A0AAD5Q416_PYTIN|nr:hypothetical protein P43SY_007456 [Pythium insidiosum]
MSSDGGETFIQVANTVDADDHTLCEILRLPGQDNVPLAPESRYDFKTVALNVAGAVADPTVLQDRLDSAGVLSTRTASPSIPDAPPAPYVLTLTGGRIRLQLQSSGYFSCCSTVLSGLAPNQSYEVDVWAMNTAGVSDITAAIFSTPTDASRAYMPLQQNITLKDHETRASFEIQLIDNLFYEGNRTFGIRVRESMTPETRGSIVTRQIQVLEDDDPSKILTPPPTNATVTQLTGGLLEIAWDTPKQSDAAGSFPSASGFIIRVTTPGERDNFFNLFNVSAPTFTLSGLQPTTLYRFEIATWSLHGMSVFSSVLLAMTSSPTPPTAPRNLRVVNITSTSVALQWEPPADAGGSLLHAYAVMLQVDGRNESIIANLPANTTAFIVNDLTAVTSHTLRVVAGTLSFPASMASAAASVTAATSNASLPQAPPAPELSGSGSAKGGSLALRVRNPRDTGGVPVVDYALYLRRVRDPPDASNSQPSTEEPFTKVCDRWSPTTTAEEQWACVVYRLLANSTYEAFAVVQNAVGLSPPSQLARFRTAVTLNVPSAPLNFRVTSLTAGLISLAWDLPLDLGGVADVLGYTVFQQVDTFPPAFFTVYDGQDSTDRVVTLRGLTKATSYSFSVVALNAATFCVNPDAQQKSPLLTVSTLAYSRLTPPGAPFLLSHSGGSIRLGWSAPDDLAGAPLLGYLVELLLGPESLSLTPDLLPPSATSFVHFGLLEQTEYRYAVTAVNQDGPSERSNPTTLMTSFASVPSTIQQLRVAENAGGRITLAWDPPLDTGGRAIAYYLVARQGRSDPFIVERAPFTDVYGLTASTPYRYDIQPFNGLYRGGVATLVASTTEPSTPAAPVIRAAVPFGGRIEVEWASAEDTGGVPVLSYRVALRTSSDNVTVGLYEGNDTQWSFLGLTANTQFELVASSVNQAGESDEVTLDVSTGPPDIPSAPPAPIADDVRGGRLTIRVELPVYVGGESVTLLLYQGSTLVRSFAPEVSDRSVTIFNLFAETEYAFYVVARNSGGQASGSTLTIRTTAISVPSAMTGVMLREVTFDRLLVAWQKVEDTGGDRALQYEVEFIHVDESDAPVVGASSTAVRVSDSSVWLTGLESSSRYRVTVTPVTSTGLSGAPSEPVVYATEAPNPGRVLAQGDEFSVREDNGLARVPVMRVDGSFGESSFTFETADDTAVAGVNYVGQSDTMTLGTNVKTGVVPIQLINDAVYNPNISFIVRFRDQSTGIETETRVILLDDADAGVLSFSTAQVRVLENAGQALLPITRNGGATPRAVIQPFIAHAESAVHDRFSLAEDEIVFEEGESIMDLTVQIQDDTEFQYWPDSVNVSFRVLEGGAWMGDIPSTNLTLSDDGDISPPKEPTQLRLLAATGGSLVVSWAAPVDRGGVNVAPSYQVMATVQDGPSRAAVVAPTNEPTLQAVIYGLDASTTYEVSAIALNAAISSAVSSPSKVVLMSTKSATKATSPINVQLLSASSSSVLLAWDPPLDLGGSNLVSYKLYHQLDAENSTEFSSVTCWADTRCTINGLTALATYTILIRAVTTVGGDGELSLPLTVATSNPDVPDPPPMAALTWRSAGAMSIAMLKPINVGGSEIQRYRLFLRAPGDLEFSQVYEGESSTYTIYRLQRRTPYQVKYQVVNAVGPSDFGPVLTAETLEKSLPSAPLRMEMTSRTGGSIGLSWQEPLDVGGRDISGYIVMIRRPETPLSQEWIGYDGRAIPHLSGTVYSLTANTTYTVQVLAQTEVSNCFDESERARSDPFNVTTALPTLPGTPPTLVLVRYTGGLVELQWTRPLDTGGVPVLSYTVILIAPTGTVVTLTQTQGDDDASPTPRTFVHTDLVESTEYSYAVFATTSVGSSANSNVLTVKTSIATPPTPPQDVRQLRDVETGGAIKIGWRRPIDTGGRPLMGYSIYRDGALIADNVPPSTSFYVDKAQLRAATQYEYSLRAFSLSFLGSENSVILQAKTSPASRPQPLVNGSTVTGPSFVVATWIPDTDTGGVPLTAFEVKLFRPETTGLVPVPGAEYVGVKTSFRFTRLAGNTTYTLVAIARNSIGDSDPFVMELETLPPTTPDAPPTPLVLSVFGGNITLGLQSPLDDGGAVVTSLKLYEPTLGMPFASRPISGGSSIQFTVYGVVGQTNYAFTATAVNALGEGGPSPSLRVTSGPINAPGAIPALPSLQARTGSTLTVSWLPPLDTGGDPGFYYNVQVTVAATRVVILEWTVVSPNFRVTGLAFNTLYIVTVRASNRVGNGPWSLPLVTNTLPDAAGVFSLAVPSTSQQVFENASRILVPIQRTNGLSGSITINYAIAGAGVRPATVGQDLSLTLGSTATTGSLVFDDQQMSANLTIFITNDAVYEEPNEQFTVRITSVSGAAIIGPPSMITITILDDGDAGVVSFSASEYKFREDAIYAVLPIVRIGGSSGVLLLSFTYTDVTASIDRDYRRLPGGIMLRDGQTTAELRILLVNDRVYEYPDEAFVVQMVVSGGGSLGRASATVIIQDDGDVSAPAACPPIVVVSTTGGSALLQLGLPAHNGSAKGILTNFAVRMVSEASSALINTSIVRLVRIGRLTALTSYRVSVAANNSVGPGPFSDEVTFSTSFPTLPGAVSALSATDVTGGSVLLSWLPPEDTGGVPITKYRVYKFNAPGNGTAPEAGNTVLTPPFANGWGAIGPMIRVTMPVATLPGPAMISVDAYMKATGGSVSVSWQPPIDAGGAHILGYSVYARNASSPFFLALNASTRLNLFATVERLYAQNWYELFVLAHNGVPPEPLAGLVTCIPGSRSIITTQDLSRTAVTGSVIAVEVSSDHRDKILVVGDISKATKGTLPLLLPISGAPLVNAKAAIIGQVSTFANLSTIAPTSPKLPPPVELVNATGGAITLRVRSPDDTGGIPIEEVVVLIDGAQADSTSVQSVVVPEGALHKTWTMTFANLLPLREYTFKAVARNAISLCYFGQTVYNAPVALRTKNVTAPGVPSIEVQLVTGGGMTVKLVDPLDKGGRPIEQYLLYLAPDDSNAWSRVYRGTKPSAAVARLQPLSKYQLMLSVFNGVYESPNSTVIVQSTTKISSPGPCSPATLVNATGGTLTVAWEHPPDDGGSAVTEFFVTISKGGSNRRVVRVESGLTWTFFGLSSQTTYQVTVQARNSIGRGPDGEPAFFETTHPSPPVGDIQVSVLSTTGGAARISFNPPQDLGGTAREDMQYKVLVNGQHMTTLSYNDLEQASSSAPVTLRQRRLATTTGIVIGGLDPLGLYDIQVQAMNSVGAGSVSSGSPAQTKEPTVPSPPQAVTVPTATGGSMTVEWKAPADTGGLPILEYAVAVASSSSGPFSVRNALGASPESNVISASTTAIGPPSPPGKVQVVSVSHDRIDCTWAPPIDAGGSMLASYEVTVTDVTAGGGLVLSTIMTSIVLSGLQPSHEYAISVVAKNQNQDPSIPSATRFVTTAHAAGAPADPIISCVSFDAVYIVWNPAPGATEYRLLRDGNEVYTGTSTRFMDAQGLVEGTAYGYELLTNSGGSWASATPSLAIVANTQARSVNETHVASCTAPMGFLGVQNYAANLRKAWKIEPLQSFAYLTLSFSSFDLESDHDVVVIEDAVDASTVWRGGGYRTGTFVLQLEHPVIVRFQSDASVSRSGFALSFEIDAYSIIDVQTQIPPPQNAGRLQQSPGLLHGQDKVLESREIMDSSERGTAPKAVKTISRALTLVPDGGTIFVYPGVYKGALNRELRVSSRSLSIASLKGYAWTIWDLEQSGHALFLENAANLSVSGLSIRRGLASTPGGGALRVWSSSTLTLREVLIAESSASQQGGAIAVVQATVVLVQTSISACE